MTSECEGILWGTAPSATKIKEAVLVLEKKVSGQLPGSDSSKYDTLAADVDAMKGAITALDAGVLSGSNDLANLKMSLASLKEAIADIEAKQLQYAREIAAVIEGLKAVKENFPPPQSETPPASAEPAPAA